MYSAQRTERLIEGLVPQIDKQGDNRSRDMVGWLPSFCACVLVSVFGRSGEAITADRHLVAHSMPSFVRCVTWRHSQDLMI